MHIAIRVYSLFLGGCYVIIIYFLQPNRGIKSYYKLLESRLKHWCVFNRARMYSSIVRVCTYAARTFFLFIKTAANIFLASDNFFTRFY